MISRQKELIFHKHYTVAAKIFEKDAVSIILNLFNPINKYSFNLGIIMIKTIGNKAGTKTIKYIILLNS